MRDRLPAPGKANRVRITQDDGKVIEGVLSYADDAVQEGSYYNRANVLPDDVCDYLNLSRTGAEPKDAFRLSGSALDVRKERMHRVPINNYGTSDSTINTRGNAQRLCLTEIYTNSETQAGSSGAVLFLPNKQRMFHIPNNNQKILKCINIVTGSAVRSINLDFSPYTNTSARILYGDDENNLIFVGIYDDTFRKMYFLAYKYDPTSFSMELYYKSDELNFVLYPNGTPKMAPAKYGMQYAFFTPAGNYAYCMIYDYATNTIINNFSIGLNIYYGVRTWHYVFNGKDIYCALCCQTSSSSSKDLKLGKITVQSRSLKYLYESSYGANGMEVFVGLFDTGIVCQFHRQLLKYSLTTDAKLAEKTNDYFLYDGYQIDSRYMLAGTQIVDTTSLAISVSLRDQMAGCLYGQTSEPGYLYAFYATDSKDDNGYCMYYRATALNAYRIAYLYIDRSSRICDIWAVCTSVYGHSNLGKDSFVSIVRAQTSRLTPYMPIMLP